MESLQQNTRIAPSGYREMEKGHIIQTSSELIERVRQRERNTQIKNSQEMMPYWQVQNLKPETQKE